MRSLLKLVVVMLMSVVFLQAEPLLHISDKDGFEIKVSSLKSLVVGSNDIFIVLIKDGKVKKDVKVKIKFFMPEMPGMSHMEDEKKAKFIDGKFKVNINFSMGGTWQYHLKFKTNDGKVHKIRGSVNI